MEKSFKLSVKVVIRHNNGRLLLLKRSSNCRSNAGKWDLPGGKIELGESFDRALLREVAEETGLSISLQRVVGTARRELADTKVVYLIMEGYLVTGKLQLSEEHSDYLWVNCQELLNLDLVEQFRSFAQVYYAMNLE